MCELLAMSARYPTNIRLSFDELSRHGGGTGPHRDGWGLGLLDERDAQLFREPAPAHLSAWVPFLRSQPLRARTVLGHVRRATQGARLLRNTQPFARELGGRQHLFAHNGMLPGIELDPRFAPRRFRPVGETDSEHAFCALLERLAPLWDGGELPALEARLACVAAFASEATTRGPANFVYTDGDAVFAFGHQRRHDDGTIRSPGLHVLCRSCTAGADDVPLVGLAIDHAAQQEVALLASVPLSDERWEPLREGELVVLREGRVVKRHDAMR